jgi:hypothetical protein
VLYMAIHDNRPFAGKRTCWAQVTMAPHPVNFALHPEPVSLAVCSCGCHQR